MSAIRWTRISTPRRRKAGSDIVHLRSLLSAQPATSTGQVTAVWGEIEAGLARGIKLREVWEAAKLDGLEIPYCLQLVQSGRIPSVPVGCRRRMDVVEQWLAAGEYRISRQNTEDFTR